MLRKMLADARKMRESGMSIDGILKEFGLPGGGYRNQELKKILDEVAEQ